MILEYLIPAYVITITRAEIEQYQLEREAWDMAYCETEQIPDFCIMDSNGKRSCGMLQFQDDTFRWMGELFNLPHDDIFSYEQARDLYIAARRAGIVHNHWKTCYKKLGLSPLVPTTNPQVINSGGKK